MISIDRNSRGTVAGVILAALSISTAALLLIPCNWISWSVTLICVWFAVFVCYFFRIPSRRAAGSDKLVSAVADGQVVIIEKVFEPEYLKTDCIQVSIYMNFFDMHANFWPLDGEVTYYKYHPGKHWLAFKPKASEENEHTCTAIRAQDGQEVFFKQLAGTFARRIVNYAKTGMKTWAGEQCGIIKFGSRIDMYLPAEAEILVKKGDVTRACESIIARLR